MAGCLYYIKRRGPEISERLQKLGFLVKIEPMDDYSYQIKVPESEAEEVYDLIHEWF